MAECYSHVNERVMEELSIFLGNVTVLLFLQELFLASLNVWNNGIQVAVRVPEQRSREGASK